MSVVHINQIEVRCDECGAIVQRLTPKSNVTTGSGSILCGFCQAKGIVPAQTVTGGA